MNKLNYKHIPANRPQGSPMKTKIQKCHFRASRLHICERFQPCIFLNDSIQIPNNVTIFDKKRNKKKMKETNLAMKGTLSHELEISLPADEIWSVYRGLELAELVVKLLPNVIYKMDLVEGDGGVGTILHLYFPSGE